MLYQASKRPYFAPFRPHITTELRPLLIGRKIHDYRQHNEKDEK